MLYRDTGWSLISLLGHKRSPSVSLWHVFPFCVLGDRWVGYFGPDFLDSDGSWCIRKDSSLKWHFPWQLFFVPKGASRFIRKRYRWVPLYPNLDNPNSQLIWSFMEITGECCVLICLMNSLIQTIFTWCCFFEFSTRHLCQVKLFRIYQILN